MWENWYARLSANNQRVNANSNSDRLLFEVGERQTDSAGWMASSPADWMESATYRTCQLQPADTSHCSCSSRAVGQRSEHGSLGIMWSLPTLAARTGRPWGMTELRDSDPRFGALSCPQGYRNSLSHHYFLLTAFPAQLKSLGIIILLKHLTKRTVQQVLEQHYVHTVLCCISSSASFIFKLVNKSINTLSNVTG